MMKAPKQSVLRQLQLQYSKTEMVCPRCKKVRLMTVDHIIPKSLLEQLGLDDECYNDGENLEIICITCNRFKANRIDLANPKVVPLLKKYIEKLT